VKVGDLVRVKTTHPNDTWGNLLGLITKKWNLYTGQEIGWFVQPVNHSREMRVYAEDIEVINESR
jgi:hypothetical protein